MEGSASRRRKQNPENTHTHKEIHAKNGENRIRSVVCSPQLCIHLDVDCSCVTCQYWGNCQKGLFVLLLQLRVNLQLVQNKKLTNDPFKKKIQLLQWKQGQIRIIQTCGRGLSQNRATWSRAHRVSGARASTCRNGILFVNDPEKCLFNRERQGSRCLPGSRPRFWLGDVWRSSIRGKNCPWPQGGSQGNPPRSLGFGIGQPSGGLESLFQYTKINIKERYVFILYPN